MRETRTLQLYPDDKVINAAIEELGSFGWEVINNQRCQEYNGQTTDYDGSTTTHYSTFNKVTFSREKSSEWYSKVIQLEAEYWELDDTIKIYQNKKPVLRDVSHGIGSMVIGFFLYVWYIVPGVIYSVVRSRKRAKYRQQYQEEMNEYQKVYGPKIEELRQKQMQLRACSEACILGRA